MDKKHPLAYITRLKSTKEIDSAFDMICAMNYFAGQNDTNIPIDVSRECWAHIKKLLAPPPQPFNLEK